MPAPIRRSDVDACPGALRLHAAADGPLARVRLPGGLVSGEQLTVLGEIAERWGDGHLELTSRANVQLRALTRADPAGLAARLTAAGLLPSRTHEVVRNIAAPPLASAALRALVGELDRALCADPALAALPGRFLFAVGAVALDADVAAVPAGAGYAVLLAGEDHGLRVAPDKVVPALLAAAHAFLAERGARPAWRLRELPGGPSRVAAALHSNKSDKLSGMPPAPARVAPQENNGLGTMAGVVPQEADGLVAVAAGVPLGRLGRAPIAVLARARRVVVTPWRGVVVPGLRPAEAGGWLAGLAGAGLETTPGSRWSGVTACAGRPGCAKSLTDVRADATAATTFADGLPVHWVGCVRGCGSPSGAHVRVEATPEGYVVTAPSGTVPAGDGELAQIVAEARRS